ncbi:DNA repair and recombination RAD54-like protein [Trifolium pratense]|uniref:DNA repair and recombination RAD54-like protein n=1 Tax=Trifolium pratense TaxID=57577 RepID=A0A2K3KKZ7_TRIPR|nr:DNA repair and recombination RAD54-like protein [Trifolium pratense]
MRFNGLDDMDFEGKWEGIHLKKRAQTKRLHSIFASRNHVHEEQDHKGGRSLNLDACKEMVDTYMKNFDSLPTEEDPTINEETSKLEQKEEQNVSKSDDDEENVSISNNEEENPEDLNYLWAELHTNLDGTEAIA